MRWQHAAIGGIVCLAVAIYALVVARVNSPVRPSTAAPQAAARAQPLGALDIPQDGATVTSGTTQLVQGWSVDTGADSGTGVGRVQIYVDNTYSMDATYGVSRPDIATKLGPRFDASGWSATLDASTLAAGDHVVEARAHSSLTNEDARYTSTIHVEPAPSMPTGALDTPEDGATVTGIVDVRGWAIDQTAPYGSGVDQVQVYLDDTPLSGGTYGDPRTDVLNGYGPRFEDAGFSARIDLSGQSPGPHRVEVRARSTLSGETTSYAHTITVGQPPSTVRGALDNPPDGTSATGRVEVRGWGIDASSETGTGVDRVEILLDGNAVADADLGQDRSDVAASYGAHFGASGFLAVLDLRNVTPGRHTLTVRVHSALDGSTGDYSHDIDVR